MTELTPDELGSGPAFDALVAAVCTRKWLTTSTLEEAVLPEYDHHADATVTPATVRRPPERPARRCCSAPWGDLALPPARRRAHAGRPPHQDCAP